MQHHQATSLGKAIGVVALVFFCGFATGFLANNLTGAYPASRGTQFRIDASLQDLTSRLSLNPSQVEQIRVILDDVIMEEAELLSQLRWNQLEARERIAKFLTPDQNQKFNHVMQVEYDSQ